MRKVLISLHRQNKNKNKSKNLKKEKGIHHNIKIQSDFFFSPTKYKPYKCIVCTMGKCNVMSFGNNTHSSCFCIYVSVMCVWSRCKKILLYRLEVL